MPILPFGRASVADESCDKGAFERVDDVMMVSCSAQQDVFSVVAEFEFRPVGHGLSCGLQVFCVWEGKGDKRLFVVVAEVVEEDAGNGGVRGGDGKDYPRGVKGCEEGGGEHELPMKVL